MIESVRTDPKDLGRQGRSRMPPLPRPGRGGRSPPVVSTTIAARQHRDETASYDANALSDGAAVAFALAVRPDHPMITRAPDRHCNAWQSCTLSIVRECPRLVKIAAQLQRGGPEPQPRLPTRLGRAGERMLRPEALARRSTIPLMRKRATIPAAIALAMLMSPVLDLPLNTEGAKCHAKLP